MDRAEAIREVIGMEYTIEHEFGPGGTTAEENYTTLLTALGVTEEELVAARTVRTCRVCGCTDARACPRGCHWVEPGLCSTCLKWTLSGTSPAQGSTP